MKKALIHLAILLLCTLQTWAQTTPIDDISTPDSVTAPSWEQQLVVRLQELLSQEAFQRSQVGIVVWDLTADSALFLHNHQQQMRPASTMKVVTAVTALDRLGGNYEFKTMLSFTGTVEAGTLKGDVYCKGGMDPMFSSEDLTAMVHELHKMGIDSIAGHLFADTSMKDTDKWGEGWCWDDKNPTLTPLLLNRKDYFMSAFQKALTDKGIRLCDSLVVANRLVGEATSPKDATVVCVRTHTIDQVLTTMMKESDNLYAEALFYQTAAIASGTRHTARQGRQLTNQMIEKLGFSPDNYYIADGSGLSLYNYLSPELLTAFLRFSAQQPDIMRHLLPSLPIASVDGTLKNRMRDTRAKGNVKAKTGTLSRVYSLAGYCTGGNGHQLCFTIMNQGVRSSTFARSFQDQVCAVLCEK